MLLLLFNPSTQGTLVLPGPDPSRIALVELETRSVLV